MKATVRRSQYAMILLTEQNKCLETTLSLACEKEGGARRPIAFSLRRNRSGKLKIFEFL